MKNSQSQLARVMGKNKPAKTLPKKKKKKYGFDSKARTIIFIENFLHWFKKEFWIQYAAKWLKQSTDNKWEEMAKRASRGEENHDMRGSDDV